MNASPVVGVDMGGSWVKTVIVVGSEVVHRARVPRDGSIPDMLRAIVGRAVSEHSVVAAGVGIAGLVDQNSSRFVWGPHLSDVDVDVGAGLDAIVGEYVVANDANCAAFAEWFDGAATGHRTALTVSVGTGIGAGLIVDGEVFLGEGFAGEVGHMQMAGDSTCPCGRTGCWETLVSGRQLGLAAGALGLEPSAERLVDAARSGVPEAVEVLRSAADWLGVGIANLILVLDPSIVVVAGGVSESGDQILDVARERIASNVPGRSHRSAVELVAAVHGQWAAATGAAFLAAQRSAASGPTSEWSEAQ